VRLPAVAVLLATLVLPAPARADIFVSPFLGLKFKGSTNELCFCEGAEDAKLSIGISTVVVTDRGPGVEFEFGYNPRFFESGTGDLVSRSGVTTLFGNFVLAAPIGFTRESLRPYAVGGLGWIHASANDQIGFGSFSNDFLGLALGGGAIGFVSDTTGVRFDLRYLKSISSGDVSNNPGQGSARISFWRASVGLVFR
jgi:hypothetical protein